MTESGKVFARGEQESARKRTASPEISTSPKRLRLECGRSTADDDSGPVFDGIAEDDFAAEDEDTAVDIRGEQHAGVADEADRPGPSSVAAIADAHVPEDTERGEGVKEIRQEPTLYEKLRPMFLLAFDHTPEEVAEFDDLLRRTLPPGKGEQKFLATMAKYCIGHLDKVEPEPRPCLMARLLGGKSPKMGDAAFRDGCEKCRKEGVQCCFFARLAPQVASGYGRRLLNGRIEADVQGRRDYNPGVEPRTMRIAQSDIRWIVKKRKNKKREVIEAEFEIDGCNL